MHVFVRQRPGRPTNGSSVSCRVRSCPALPSLISFFLASVSYWPIFHKGVGGYWHYFDFLVSATDLFFLVALSRRDGDYAHMLRSCI